MLCQPWSPPWGWGPSLKVLFTLWLVSICPPPRLLELRVLGPGLGVLGPGPWVLGPECSWNQACVPRCDLTGSAPRGFFCPPASLLP